MSPYPEKHPQAACKLTLAGRVQGVGFRPFVYRLAEHQAIKGWVKNGKGNVIIHAEGNSQALARFIQGLLKDAPTIAQPQLLDSRKVDFEFHQDFSIHHSDEDTEANIHVPTDYHLCPDCQRELNDPTDRRYQYPFINCTQCGPRYTLIQALPYDRRNTSMADFVLCPDCRQEYEDPRDRRFHAEPVACAQCGPQLSFVDRHLSLHSSAEALARTVAILHAGGIVAVKGVGGYHLICDACNDAAVQELRLRKARPHKPLAVMFLPDALGEHVVIDSVATSLLTDPSRPIVLTEKKSNSRLAPSIAPGLNQFGVYLPYSPLHYMLLQKFNGPLVATSANISGEPVLTDNAEVEQRLAHIADAFLHHDRPIVRPADDSVMQIVGHRSRPLRLGRGIAPLEMELPFTLRAPVLAVGGQMKNTIALAWDNRMVVSPHIGDLDSARSLSVFEQVIEDLQKLYEVDAEIIACDAHPAYQSHRWARQTGKTLIPVLHHHAHASALVLEHLHGATHKSPWLIFTWDGVGYGEDETIWGGEAFLGTPGEWKRVASFKPFYLPGGDKVGREPWRSAAALCWQIDLPYQAPQHHELVKQAWQRRINSPQSTSVGRLFDAASALCGILDHASFEGQGPMMLEAAARSGSEYCQSTTSGTNMSWNHALPLDFKQDRYEADWSGLFPVLLNPALTVETKAFRFHQILAATILEKVSQLRSRYGEFTVGLCGGVFQNTLLTELVMKQLQDNDFEVCINKRLPCNDAGISAGQIMEAAARIDR